MPDLSGQLVFLSTVSTQMQGHLVQTAILPVPLRGSWDLVSRVMGTLIKVISRCNFGYLITLLTKSHDTRRGI